MSEARMARSMVHADGVRCGRVRRLRTDCEGPVMEIPAGLEMAGRWEQTQRTADCGIHGVYHVYTINRFQKDWSIRWMSMIQSTSLTS